MTLITPATQEEPDVISFRVHCRGIADMPARLIVKSQEDGTYDVCCEVENRVSDSYGFSQPKTLGVKLSHAPHLGHRLAMFLLEELKQEIGEGLLRSPAGPPRPTPGVHLS